MSGLVERVANAVAKVHCIEPGGLLQDMGTRRTTNAKHQFRYLLASDIGVRETARMIGCSAGNVSHSMKKHEQLINGNYVYATLFREVERQIK